MISAQQASIEDWAPKYNDKLKQKWGNKRETGNARLHGLFHVDTGTLFLSVLPLSVNGLGQRLSDKERDKEREGGRAQDVKAIAAVAKARHNVALDTPVDRAERVEVVH